MPTIRTTCPFYTANILAVAFCVVLLRGEASAELSNDFLAFDSRWNHDAGPKAAGYDFSKNFKEINRYASVGEDKCFVLGRNRVHEIELGLLSATGDGKEVYSSVIKYPVSETARMMDVSFAVVLGGKTQSDSSVIIRYTTGNVGNRVEETQTFIEILCSTKSPSTFAPVHREKVGEKVVWWHRYAKGERAYLYLAPDHSTAGSGDVEPARQTISDVFIADINANGLPDLVIHRQSSRSRRSEDIGSPDFVPVGDEVIAVPYESDQRRFGKPCVVDRSVVSEANKRRIPLFQK